MKVDYRISALLLAGFALFSPPAIAQSTIHFSSGTGFFVTRDGHVVTSAHVLRQCREVTVQGAVKPARAKVIATDAANDLALLQAEAMPSGAARIRDGGVALERGERVVVVGYPGDSALSGKVVTRDAELMNDRGPLGDTRWIEFSHVVEQGNSGGPLLDGAGAVLGVIAAKAHVYRRNSAAARDELVRESDVAVSGAVLRQFLEGQGVRYDTTYSGGLLSSHRIEDYAREYLVNVQCIQ